MKEQDSFLLVEGVTKSYNSAGGDAAPLTAVSDLSISVRKGELLTIIGPNACGKTTFLYMVSGLLECDAGQIRINGRHPSEASIGYVFQNYERSLLPWRTVLDNIAFPLELQGINKSQRRKRALELLSFLKMQLPVTNYPYQLSGGQQQMAVIARALIDAPDVLLMDEPFSALNFQIRAYWQDKIMEIWEKTKVTLLFVSHDIDEAIYLADRLVLFSERPATVSGCFEVNLPRPRMREMSVSPEFDEIKKRLLQVVPFLPI